MHLSKRFYLLMLIPLGLAIGVSGQAPTGAPAIYPLEAYRPVILASYPHVAGSFTEGLVWQDGELYESAGGYGTSSYGPSRLLHVDLETGDVLQETTLDPAYFGEGIALVGDRLIQLTWREGTALVYNRDDFAPLEPFTYTGEGWALCNDGDSLWQSDGSSSLFARDPDTFEVTAQIIVTLYNRPINNLNELECVGPYIYANIWQTDQIVRINKDSGLVTALITASDLLTPEERAALEPGAVLNGIAYVPERDTFLLTGKLWPRIFEVQFTPDTGTVG